MKPRKYKGFKITIHKDSYGEYWTSFRKGNIWDWTYSTWKTYKQALNMAKYIISERYEK